MFYHCLLCVSHTVLLHRAFLHVQWSISSASDNLGPYTDPFAITTSEPASIGTYHLPADNRSCIRRPLMWRDCFLLEKMWDGPAQT